MRLRSRPRLRGAWSCRAAALAPCADRASRLGHEGRLGPARDRLGAGTEGRLVREQLEVPAVTIEVLADGARAQRSRGAYDLPTGDVLESLGHGAIVWPPVRRYIRGLCAIRYVVPADAYSTTRRVDGTSIRRSRRSVSTGAIATASMPTGGGEQRSGPTGRRCPNSGSVFGVTECARPSPQRPCRAPPRQRAEHSYDQALEDRDGEGPADRHAEGEHRGALAAALVGVDAGRVESDEQREERGRRPRCAEHPDEVVHALAQRIRGRRRPLRRDHARDREQGAFGPPAAARALAGRRARSPARPSPAGRPASGPCRRTSGTGWDGSPCTRSRRSTVRKAVGPTRRGARRRTASPMPTPRSSAALRAMAIPREPRRSAPSRAVGRQIGCRRPAARARPRSSSFERGAGRAPQPAGPPLTAAAWERAPASSASGASGSRRARRPAGRDAPPQPRRRCGRWCPGTSRPCPGGRRGP